MDPRDFHVGIKGLVFNDQNQLMLIEEHDGNWDLPGGRIEHGEQIAQALEREIKEEMGVEVTMLDQHPHWAWTDQIRGNGKWMSVSVTASPSPPLTSSPPKNASATDSSALMK